MGLAYACPNVKDATLRHTVFICSTCRKDDEATPKGEALAVAVKDLLAKSDDPALQSFEVETFECMSACANPNAISFRAPGKAAYLFSGVDAERDQEDIIAFARMYLAAKDGWIEDARPCGRLRFCLMGRIPAQEATGSIIQPE
jgi:predicted metal-binding protein